MATDTFNANRIEYIRKLAHPSAQQKLLLLLDEKGADRTQSDEKNMSALLKAERAADRATKARTAAAKIISGAASKERADERKARNHRLIQLGTLLEMADLGQTDRGTLMGAMLAIKRMGDDVSKYKLPGDTFLAEREAKKKKESDAQPATSIGVGSSA